MPTNNDFANWQGPLSASVLDLTRLPLAPSEVPDGLLRLDMSACVDAATSAQCPESISYIEGSWGGV